MMLVEPLRRIVLGINKESKDTKFGSGDPHDDISQQDATKAAALIRLGNRQPAKQGGGYDGITRQLLGHFGSQRIQRHARGSERIETRKITGGNMHRHKAGGDAPLDVLRGLLSQISVQSIRSAHETRAVMVGQWLATKLFCHGDAIPQSTCDGD